MIRYVLPLIFLTISTIFAFFSFYEWEPGDFKSNTFAYKFKVDEKIKGYEFHTEEGSITFSFYASDGLKPTIVTARYGLNISLQSFKNQLIQNSYQCEDIEKNISSKCAKDYYGGRISLIIEQLTGIGVEVEAAFVGVGDE
ncbi:hypothetical protein Q8W40_02195 [Vibrio penaeicida]|uniref:hypothetical protein n=1 Tax=Vibrio penaeicida TaxID=104609 RepID=UPI002734B63A|nr:hypothetical protein [Vibrio penaeicida]MDP2570977.1 hypothetical protein [Vibrio penaeicida]